VQFFNFLNDFFRDVTVPIVDTSGEIYQYVGDEIVITWDMKRGLKNANCIRCFFRMQELMLRRSGFYRDKYGVAPEFKAGIHCGAVTTGEIGVIKKDIVYSGDTMNTSARIQAVCNKFRVRMLISKNLLDLLDLPPLQYHPKRVGIFELKGKKQLVELYTFEEAMEPRYVGDGGISAT
jgi:adenylate cyclase